MPEQVRAARKTRPKAASRESEAKRTKEAPTKEQQEEWDAIEADIDQALAEMEAEYETAESFVKAYKQKGGQAIDVLAGKWYAWWYGRREQAMPRLWAY